MLSNIGIAKQREEHKKEETAVDMLLGCHQRIRHFSGVSGRLAAAEGSPAAEIVQAAEGLYRYFTIALPLHEEDENDSIQPRLRKSVPDGELSGPAADAMVEQHRSIDEIVERLVPLWEILRATPERLPDLAPEMKQLSATLQQMFELHLKLEEETVFPAMQKYLSQAQLNEIVSEMKARRA